MPALSSVKRHFVRVAYVAFGITTASLLLLITLYVGDWFGYTSVPQTDAGICFPRTAVQPKSAWWGGFSCQAGYSIRGFGMNVGSTNNSGWYECVQEACNNPKPPPPPQPTGLTYSCSAVTYPGYQVNISWNPSPLATNYKLRFSGITPAQCAALPGWSYGFGSCNHESYGTSSVQLPLSLGSAHEFLVQATNSSGTSTPVGTGSFVCPAQPLGNHDQSVCPGTEPNSPSNVISGWACDPDSWNTAIQVHVYRDGPSGGGGVFLGAVTANQNRPDIAGSCGGTTAHGFTFQIPEEMRDNAAHNYYVYAVDDGTNGTAGNPLLGGSPKAATCTIPPPTDPSASCTYNPTRNLFEAVYTWTKPNGYDTFYTRIGDAAGNGLTTNPGYDDVVVGTTKRFDMSNADATNPGFTSEKNFTYWIHTRWLHPSDPNNDSLWRLSAEQPPWPNGIMTCPLPDPLQPSLANATCVGSFASTSTLVTFNMFTEFASRYNLEYTPSGGSMVLIENETGLVTRTLPWGRYTWRVQGENRTDRRGPWQSGNNFECRPPNPVISLTATPKLVSPGSTATLNWSVQANYQVNCTIAGGGTSRTVSHSGAPLQTSGSVNTSPIVNTTDFRLVCTPNISALPDLPAVEVTERVEVVPTLEER